MADLPNVADDTGLPQPPSAAWQVTKTVGTGILVGAVFAGGVLVAGMTMQWLLAMGAAGVYSGKAVGEAWGREAAKHAADLAAGRFS